MAPEPLAGLRERHDQWRPEVWVSEGWARRCGLPHERTGFDDTPEQVSTFRVERAVLFDIRDAAHRATVSVAEAHP